MDKKTRIDIKKIGAFLKSMDGAEYMFLEHTIHMRSSIQQLINRHGLAKEEVCRRFEINPNIYSDFVKGNYNYSLHDMANLNSAFVELEALKLEEQVPINPIARK